jgi:hypothetical protein
MFLSNLLKKISFPISNIAVLRNTWRYQFLSEFPLVGWIVTISIPKFKAVTGVFLCCLFPCKMCIPKCHWNNIRHIEEGILSKMYPWTKVWNSFSETVMPLLGSVAREAVRANKDPVEIGSYDAVKIQNEILEGTYSKCKDILKFE